MNRSLHRLLAVGAALISGSILLGQAQSKSPASTPAPPPPQQKLVRVATLGTVDANREFQENVQLLQVQRQAAVDLNAAIDKEKDAKKKAELRTKLDQLMAQLNKNNDEMQKHYGFSLNRNYTMVVEKSHIYMLVSDEEAAAVEKAQKSEAPRTSADKSSKAKSRK